MINEAILAQVVEAALRQTQGDKRWANAIKRGAELIKSNRCFEVNDGKMVVLSESGHNYTVNGACHTEEGLCPAFAKGQPCKHRAAYRLMQRYREMSH